MRFHRQRYLAAREDGHTADGIPGDCLRTSAATILRCEPDELRHYALYLSWWAVMRDEALTKFGLDWAYTTPALLPTWTLPADALLIGSGPSPRGEFWHSVVLGPDLGLVHDPHPSDAGLVSVEDLLILCQVSPMSPPPVFAALEPASRSDR